MSNPNPTSTGSPVLRRTSAPMDENMKFPKDDVSSKTEKHDRLQPARQLSDSEGPVRKKPVAPLSASIGNLSLSKNVKTGLDSSGPSKSPDPVDSLLAKLSQQQTLLHRQGDALRTSDEETAATAPHGKRSTSGSQAVASSADWYAAQDANPRPSSTQANPNSVANDEVLRLKLELAQAQNQITRLDTELAQSRHSRPGVDSARGGSPLDCELSGGSQNGQAFPRSQMMPPPYPGPATFLGRDGSVMWPTGDDSRSDTSDAMSATSFNRPRDIWGGSTKTARDTFAHGGLPIPNLPHAATWGPRGPEPGFAEPAMGFQAANPETYRNERLTPDFDLTVKPQGGRRANRFNGQAGHPAFSAQSTFNGSYGYNSGQFDGSNVMTAPAQGPPAGAPMYANYPPPPIGTPLSPLASEFTTASGPPSWKSEATGPDGQTYLPTTEPLNYRRLLDRNVNCNWKYIVDKIVCNNDQQASIFLQQKLKVGTPDQKYEIVEAIVAQAYPLMVNRFGNFLVQRCFEHGTPEQVIKIAEAIRGSTLSLSMDPFGCHVVQKAFDSVPEDYKAIMVRELLRRIPETVIHRYACHVWQKLFELRWTESPPQIMKFVNEALSGMWHEVALGETGSLVVQNIFENCLEEDKRPAIEEVLANIDIVAHGQFGNWCIQHICEHGAPADRSRAIDHVIRYAANYSMDQYASKVVEKCLKIGGGEFLHRYLDRVCEGTLERPRIPLIDIASDQYGNYLIQWILTNAGPQHREVVAAHIRKHMVSLRGSKFGSRVGMLCTNPAVATRPGPGSGIGRMPANPRYGGRTYQ